jgi:hypothetical protein
MNQNITKGFTTSEFYVTIVGIGGILFSFAQQNCNFTPDKILALAGIVIAYVGGRTYLKTFEPDQPSQPTPPTTPPSNP